MDNQEKIGEHKGSWFHTIGQRKGLGLGQGPWFVVDKDLEKNIVYVSHADHFNNFSKNEFYLTDMNWINGEADLDQSFYFKLRHGPERVIGKIKKEGQQYKIILNGSDTGLAPGQHAVVYLNTRCLGGGVIHWKQDLY